MVWISSPQRYYSVVKKQHAGIISSTMVKAKDTLLDNYIRSRRLSHFISWRRYQVYPWKLFRYCAKMSPILVRRFQKEIILEDVIECSLPFLEQLTRRWMHRFVFQFFQFQGSSSSSSKNSIHHFPLSTTTLVVEVVLIVRSSAYYLTLTLLLVDHNASPSYPSTSNQTSSACSRPRVVQILLPALLPTYEEGEEEEEEETRKKQLPTS